VRAIQSSHFGKLSFDSVHIYSAEELECIIKDSNSQTDNRLLSKQVFVNSPSKLNSSELSQILQQFPELIQAEVALAKGIGHKIFSLGSSLNPSSLKYLVYRPNDYYIHAIEEYAFDWLPQLETVKLSHIAIKSISPNAFSFRSNNHGRRVIFNLDDCQLSDSIWEEANLNISADTSLLLMLGNDLKSI